MLYETIYLCERKGGQGLQNEGVLGVINENLRSIYVIYSITYIPIKIEVTSYNNYLFSLHSFTFLLLLLVFSFFLLNTFLLLNVNQTHLGE